MRNKNQLKIDEGLLKIINENQKNGAGDDE